ncbi:hypothetical protein HID58_009275 [Brassica napus]|uniref:FAS1 domain-containing protein n=1 Tax=Brassica napus TaxID=3708 RepID=A0ABQ8DS79_BRANA|nr:fasciclin-like arabinogalactan protein 1 [Brassica napus]KAH0932158.1 hypothetical protein HID58_009275 [Brassica napus]
MAEKMGHVIISYILPLLILLPAGETHAHDVTRLLAKHPSFSSFNHYLTRTHLADEINRRTPITVCAVDNAAMYALTSKGYTVSTLRKILSLHVLLEYFGAKELHQLQGASALAPTLLLATGPSPVTTEFVNIGVEVGSVTGFVNITDLKGGKVGFGSEGGGLIDSSFVTSLEEVTNNISIIQISGILLSDAASAP